MRSGFANFHSVALMLVAFAVSVMAPNAFAAEDDLAYTVSGVTVDETADNAALAREQAMIKARRQALSMLAERILSGDDLKKFQLPADDMMGSFIQDFEIQGEKVAPTRYMASMTFRFIPDVVRSYLGQTELGIRQGAEHSVLILPFLSVEGKNLLWEEGNDWLAAWKRAPHRDLLTDIFVPTGDVLDAEAAGVDAVLSGATETISKLTSRYGAKEAVIAMAAGGTADKPLTIEIYQFVAGELSRTGTLNVVANDVEDTATLMDLGVTQVGDYLNVQQQAVSGGHRSGKLEIAANAAFGSAAQWADIQRRLDQIEGLEKSVVSLGQMDAGLELTWTGDEATLRTQMAAQGLTLGAPVRQVDAQGGASDDDVVYEVRLQGDVTSPAAETVPAVEPAAEPAAEPVAGH